MNKSKIRIFKIDKKERWPRTHNIGINIGLAFYLTKFTNNKVIYF